MLVLFKSIIAGDIKNYFYIFINIKRHNFVAYSFDLKMAEISSYLF